ncbi:flagellar export apparatus protein FliQ [Planctomycetota bacterium]|jgi:flagellar biosynthetic protein FliQ|nr:flagellar biosynthesis protein FliQ [Planctomycetota bacterium]GDY03533.1 flagellar export apparatus protein FliQ [Planctomycetota bacterium]
MDHNTLLDLAKSALMTALLIVTPALLVGMAVGLLVSFFQTITSLQEQTLTIVPKMLAVVATLILLMPWILGTLREYTTSLFENLAAYGKAG